MDTVSLSLGRHQFKFGADYRRLAPFAVPSNPRVAHYNYLQRTCSRDKPAHLSLRAAHAPAYPLYTNFSAFAQDEWRVSPRLSLSLGLRWEVNPAPGVDQGIEALHDSRLRASILGRWRHKARRSGRHLVQFCAASRRAYILDIRPDWETVVRGGGGVFFDTGQQLGSLGFDWARV